MIMSEIPIRKLYDPQEDTETQLPRPAPAGHDRKLYDPQEDTETLPPEAAAGVEAPQALRSARGY